MQHLGAIATHQRPLHDFYVKSFTLQTASGLRADASDGKMFNVLQVEASCLWNRNATDGRNRFAKERVTVSALRGGLRRKRNREEYGIRTQGRLKSDRGCKDRLLTEFVKAR